MKSKKETLKKVILQFENETRTLEGEDVEKWSEMCDSMASLSYIHGHEYPELNWKIKAKKKSRVKKKS